MRRTFRWLASTLALALAAVALEAQTTISSRAADLRVGGRLHTQYQGSSVDGAVNDFFIRRARLIVDGTFNDFFVGRLQTDFAGGAATLLDAYVRMDLDEAFRLSVGQFKRSFDIFELDSSTDLSVIERDGRIPGFSACTGVGSVCSFSRLTEALDYAGRDAGVRLDGTSETFMYQATLTNGTGVGVGDENDGKSFSGRAGVAASERLTLAANLGMHDYVAPGGDTEQALAWSADAQWGTWREGLLVQAAIVGGDNWASLDAADDFEPRQFLAFQAVGSYYRPLDGDRVVAVEPLFRVSVADPAGSFDDDGGTLLTPGVMLYFLGRNKVGANLDYYVPQSDALDSELVLRLGTFLYFSPDGAGPTPGGPRATPTSTRVDPHGRSRHGPPAGNREYQSQCTIGWARARLRRRRPTGFQVPPAQIDTPGGSRQLYRLSRGGANRTPGRPLGPFSRRTHAHHMFKTLRGRLITIAIIVGLAGWQLYDHKTQTGEWLKLGLDLQGGMHLVLEVDDPDSTMTSDARSDMIDRVDRIIRTRIDEFGVEEPLIQKVGCCRLIVELAGIQDEDRAKGIIQENAYLEFKLVLPTADFEQALPRIDRAIVASLGVDSIRAMGRDIVDEGEGLDDLLFGAADTAVADSAAADTLAADPAAAAADSAEAIENALRPFSSLLFTGDVDGAYFVAAEDRPIAEQFLAMEEVQRAFPRDQQVLWGADLIAQGARNYYRLYVLEEEPFLTGEELENATAGRDPQFNQSQVQFELSRAGGRQFARFSGANVGNYLAIVLDDEVMSAPVIRDRIGARGQIEMGQGTPLEEARDLALVLRAGALPARINIIEERTVGPSLGQDSIDQGTLAGLVGIAIVIVIMMVYYGMAGVLAVGALAVYLLLVLGGLAGINATLTVPGIAGLILSIGMAVDANVLIFERIREELGHGRATRTAVDEGFQHALSAIVDANITTLITACILFYFGTGPVQGFAVTLSIGIIASFFSALFVTRSFFLAYLSGKKASDPISI